MNTATFYDGYWGISCLIHRNWRAISTSKHNEIFIKYLLLPNNLLGNNVNTVIFYDGYWWISCLIHRNWRALSPSVLRTSGDIASQFLWMSAWYSPISIIKNDSILSILPWRPNLPKTEKGIRIIWVFILPGIYIFALFPNLPAQKPAPRPSQIPNFKLLPQLVLCVHAFIALL